METREPVLLLVVVEAGRLRWFAAELALDGTLTPLLRSEPGDLASYRGLPFDEQVSFLRHRFCGVLQRGCHRLWARDRKARAFVFLFEGQFSEARGDLPLAVAEHLRDWMHNPPAFAYAWSPPTGLRPLTDEMGPPHEDLVRSHLAALDDLRADPEAGELARVNGAWRDTGA